MDSNQAAGIFEKTYREVLRDLNLPTQSHAKHYLTQQLPRYKMLYGMLHPYLARGKVLDIGIYPGLFTYVIKQLGVDVEAVDLEPERIPHEIRKSLKIHQTDIESAKITLESSSYDAFLFLAILEHLRLNPLAVLRRLKGLLKPGGRLFVQTPNLGYWRCRLNLLLGKSFDESPYAAYSRLETLGHPGHIRVYTMSEAKEMLTKCGFKIELARFFNNDDLEPLWPPGITLVNRITGYLPSLRRQLFIIAKPELIEPPREKTQQV
jgi:SAM-dependent methyltransferase